MQTIDRLLSKCPRACRSWNAYTYGWAMCVPVCMHSLRLANAIPALSRLQTLGLPSNHARRMESPAAAWRPSASSSLLRRLTY